MMSLLGHSRRSMRHLLQRQPYQPMCHRRNLNGVVRINGYSCSGKQRTQRRQVLTLSHNVRYQSFSTADIEISDDLHIATTSTTATGLIDQESHDMNSPRHIDQTTAAAVLSDSEDEGDDLENDEDVDFDDNDEVESDSDDEFDELDDHNHNTTNTDAPTPSKEQLMQQRQEKESTRIRKDDAVKKKKRDRNVKYFYLREVERQLLSESNNTVDIALQYCDENKFPIGSFYNSIYLVSHIKHSKRHLSYSSDKSAPEQRRSVGARNLNVQLLTKDDLDKYNRPMHSIEDAVGIPVIQHVYRVMNDLKQRKDGQNTLELQCQVVNASFSLLDRIIREEAAMNILHHTHGTQSKSVGEKVNNHDSIHDINQDIPSLTEVRISRFSGKIINPRTVSKIVKKWKDAMLQPLKMQSSFRVVDIHPLAHPKMMSARELLYYIQGLTTSWLSTTRNSKRFPKNIALYDTVTMNMIMEVIIKQQTDLSTAPRVAQSIFDFILENGKNQSQEYGTSYDDVDDIDGHKTKDSEFQIKPNLFTYGLLMSSWAHSGLPIAGIKMEEIIDSMQRDSNAPKPSSGTYGILLRYYSNRGEIAHLHRILQRMSLENLQPNIDSYANVLYCCCKNQQISKAAFIMNQVLMEVDQHELKYQHRLNNPDLSKHEMRMMNYNDFCASDHSGNVSDDEHTYKILQESIFNMLVAYRDAVISPSSSRELINQYIKDAEHLVARLRKNSFILRMRDESNDKDTIEKSDLFDRITNVLMVIYARADRIHDAEVLFAKSTSSNDLRYLSLIKAYSARHLPERATALLHRMIKDTNLVSMNSSCFAAVVDAWADAAERNNSDALKNAIQIVQLMDTNERCQQLNVRPCVAVFNSVLKCLSNIKKSNPGVQSTSDSVVTGLDNQFDPCQTAIEILNEMEERSKTFKTVAPNHISYTLVVKTCFRNNKLELADEMLRRMEDSNTPPDLRTYSDILLHYSTLGTEDAAKQTENVFEYIKYLSMTKPSLKPDIVCYSILLNAWMNCKTIDTTEHAWRIYQRMQNDGIEMDSVFASRVISYLASYAVNCPYYCNQYAKLDQQHDFFTEPIGLESSLKIPSSTPINLRRAAMVLEEMTCATFMDKKPNERLYRFVIKGFLSIGDLVTATSLLLHMTESYMNGNNTNAKPNEHLMSTVVMAWVSYGDLIKATLLLNKLAELYCTKQIPVGPDMGTYRTLIAHWRQSLHLQKDHYLKQLNSYMVAVEKATNPSLETDSLSTEENSTRTNQQSFAEQSEISSPQTFLATALAVLKRHS